jgi:cobalt-zinc-cadmium efflux system outer membrane protein
MNLRVLTVIALAFGLGLSGGAAFAAGEITLEQAMKKAFSQHPGLAAAAAAIDARAGAEVQAELLPNPEFEIEVEELGAKGGAEALETSIYLSQPFELGGKRSRRLKVASLATELARVDSESLRLDLEAQVKTAFIDALAAQEKVTLQEELVALSEETLNTVAGRVEAGKVSPVEESQARLEVTKNQIELRKARAEKRAARASLAGLWGAAGTEMPSVAGQLGGRLEALPPISTLEELTAAIRGNPDLKRWNTEIAHSEATRELNRADGIPDLSLTGGVRSVDSGENNTFIIGLSMPIPLFNRNQGAVAEATAAIARTRAQRRAAERDLRAELARVHQETFAAREEAQALINTLLPGAEQIYQAIREGYQWGKFDYLVLLDAQRTLLETRERLVQARATALLASVTLERLTANSTNR